MLREASRDDDAAIEATIEHARGAPFYKSLPKVRSSVELRRAPFLDKETAAAEQERLVVPGEGAPSAALAAGVVSSATTRSGRPLRVMRDEGAPGPSRGPGRVVRVMSPRHGAPLADHADQILLPATLHPNTVDVLMELLALDEVAHLVIPVSTLKWVTVAMQERGISPARFGVREIGTTGYPLTAHARIWLERAWRAVLFDNYSLSELRGYAEPCAACGFAHWRGAPTWFEVLDPANNRSPQGRAEGALGELVATTLFPEVRRMPLVRYRTGDIVELGPSCQGRRGVRVRGRLTHSLVREARGRTVYQLLSRDILELGEASPDVGMEPHPAERLGRVPSSDIGVPRALVRDGALVVELRFDPERHRARARAVREAFEALVLDEVKKHRPAVVLCRPGEVDVSRWVLKL